jgi:propanediol dehydratase small subunit
VKRANLVSKQATKKSAIVKGNEHDAVEGFTKRVLLSLVVDVTELRKTTERLQVQVFTLAKAHGIVPPGEDD